uniref:Retrovirus-related Pol polyprotein from transposon TNT 1-94 n=1 Tax=Tanacetum cinerariifolium TaxID=118510 RepID=A0A6L2NQJ5_TANCI|nr:retrovirus-related Pol polyprotein from transposon TNT 1-94 [Tanacetum cinerariifolium]
MVPAAVSTQSKPVPITSVISVTRPRHAKTVVTKTNSPTPRHINRSPSPKASNSLPRVTAVKAPIVNAAQGVHAKWEWKPKCPILNHVSRNTSASMTLKRFYYNDALGRSKSGVIDSGCSRHITGNMSYLSDFEELNGGYVAFGGNPKGGNIFRKGKIKTGKLDFDDVYFVNELKFNLFSILQMCDKKNSVLFTDTECLVLSPEFMLPDESQVLLRVYRENNMYNVNLQNIVPSGDLTCLFAKATLDESNLWHRRLGHINFKTMNKLVKGNIVRGLPTKVFEIDNTCVACKKGKQHRASCKTKPISSVDQPLYMLHMDLFGPTFVKSLNKKSYCLVVIDDYNRFTLVFFLATKDEASPILKTFITGLENQLSLKVKVIRSDNGTEFKNHDLNQFCVIKRIKKEFSVPRTPQQNENKPKVAGSGPIWLFDIDTLTKTMNYQLVTADNQSNPSAGNTNGDAAFNKKELEFDEKKPESEVNVSPSSSAQSKKQDDKTKREAKGKSLGEFFIGYRNLSAEFEDFSDNNINEVNAVGTLVPTVGYSQLFDDIEMPELEDITYSDDEDDVGAKADFNNLETSITVSHIPTTRVHKDHHMTQIIGDLSSATQTRSMTGWLKIKRVHQALKDPSWIEAMQDEILQFKMQKVWVLVDLPYGKRAIGTKWVFRNKKDERGIVVWNKARLVAQGHTQDEGIDYEEVFAPVAKIEAIRLFLAYASFMGFMVYQIDVKSAFLYKTIEEEVYVCQPPGFEDPDYSDKVYKVVKELYGLHQAPRAWYETLANYLLKNGFQRGKIDQTLFIKRQKGDIVLVQIYVDDIIFVKQKKDGIFISQDKYVAEILRKFRLTDGKSASTPIDTEKPLLKDPDGKDVDMHTYRSMIGSLMYLTLSRPYIMFAASFTAVSSKVSAVWSDELFWTIVAVKKVNDVTRLQALVDKKKVVVTEAIIRDALCLDDAEGVECLLNEEIYAELARIDYEKPSTKLTFYKAFFLSQWKFLIHTILQCMKAKRTSWNEFSSSMASVVICLSSAQEVKQGDANENVENVNAGDVAKGDVSAANDEVPTADEEPSIPSPTPPTPPPQPSHDILSTSQEAKEVVDNAKDDQDADVQVNADIQGRTAESQAKIYKIDLDHANKVLSMQEEELEPVELQEVVDIVTTAKIITEVVTAGSTTITAAEVPVPAATIAAAPTLTAAHRRRTNEKNLMLYLKNVDGFKMDYFKGMSYNDIRPIFEAKFNSNMAFLQKTKEQIDEEESRTLKRINETPTEKAAKRQKLDEEVEELKRQLQIVPNKDDDSLVKERFANAKPKNFSDDFLLITLGAMFEKPDIHAQIWINQRSVHGPAKVKGWKLLESCGVQIITFTTTQLILLVEKKYPLTRFTLDQMLNVVRLKVEDESKVSLELLSFGVDAAKEFKKNMLNDDEDDHETSDLKITKAAEKSSVTGEHMCMLLKPLTTGDIEVNGTGEMGFFGPYYRGAWPVMIDEFVEHIPILLVHEIPPDSQSATTQSSQSQPMSHEVRQHRTSTDSVVNQIRCTSISQESTQWLDHMIKEQLRDEKFKANEDAEDLITRNGRVTISANWIT